MKIKWTDFNLAFKSNNQQRTVLLYLKEPQTIIDVEAVTCLPAL